MNARHLLGAAIAALALASIGCGTDRGTDGGTQNIPYDGGQKTDGGNQNPGLQPTVLAIPDVKHAPYSTYVEVDNVTVNEVIYAKAGNNNAFRADFWVQDASLHGLFISKFYTDVDNAYLPVPGDNVSLTGWFNTEQKYTQQTGYRYVVGSAYTAYGDAGTTDGLMHITKNSTGARPTPFEVDGGYFGDAQGGLAKANSSLAGVRVHIPGERHITNFSPPGLANPNNPGHYYGFEITGGILVNTYKTAQHAWTDAGTECDWGSHSGTGVTFSNGVSGTWDTYTYAGCTDNGADPYNCASKKNNNGNIPPFAVDAGYTYVIYPDDCSDLPGADDN